MAGQIEWEDHHHTYEDSNGYESEDEDDADHPQNRETDNRKSFPKMDVREIKTNGEYQRWKDDVDQSIHRIFVVIPVILDSPNGEVRQNDIARHPQAYGEEDKRQDEILFHIENLINDSKKESGVSTALSLRVLASL